MFIFIGTLVKVFDSVADLRFKRQKTRNGGTENIYLPEHEYTNTFFHFFDVI